MNNLHSNAAGMVIDLVRLWDGPSVSADDYNEAMCAIEDRMRTFAQQSPAPVVAHDAPECSMCNDSGIVGFPPDQYEECPDCLKARAAAPTSAQPDRGAAAPIYAVGASASIEGIADELEAEALNYEGDFADTVKGCVEALREIAASPASQPVAPADESGAYLMKLLNEADGLLWIASGAMLKMGLRDKGSDCGLPHEVREFALEFSNEGRDGPGALQVRGTGRYRAWLKAARALAVPTTVPDHSEREAANAGGLPTVAWLIEWKTAAGGDRRMVAPHNFAADVRAEHGNATVTELVPRALATIAAGQEAARECQYPHESAECKGCGWTDRAAALIAAGAAGKEAANAKDAARLAYCVAHGFPQCPSSGWWAPLPNGHLIRVRGSGPIAAIDAAMAAVGAAGQGGE